MPYIITMIDTLDENGISPLPTQPVAYSRVAVATLDDVRRSIIETHEKQGVWIGGDALHGPVDRLAQGSVSIGPLPDGTIIEVTQVGWIDFEMMARRGDTGLPPIEIFDRDDYRADLIAAFNAS